MPSWLPRILTIDAATKNIHLCYLWGGGQIGESKTENTKFKSFVLFWFVRPTVDWTCNCNRPFGWHHLDFCDVEILSQRTRQLMKSGFTLRNFFCFCKCFFLRGLSVQSLMKLHCKLEKICLKLRRRKTLCFGNLWIFFFRWVVARFTFGHTKCGCFHDKFCKVFFQIYFWSFCIKINIFKYLQFSHCVCRHSCWKQPYTLIYSTQSHGFEIFVFKSLRTSPK